MFYTSPEEIQAQAVLTRKWLLAIPSRLHGCHDIQIQAPIKVQARIRRGTSEPLNSVAELLNGPCISWNRVTFSMIKHLGIVPVTHVVESHSSCNVWITAANDVKTGNINHMLILVG